jgi:hypothetical protein
MAADIAFALREVNSKNSMLFTQTTEIPPIPTERNHTRIIHGRLDLGVST